jgi:hypothetical protein
MADLDVMANEKHTMELERRLKSTCNAFLGFVKPAG